MRKHVSSTTQLLELIRRKAEQLKDARIDAATVEFAEILMHDDDIDFNELDERIAQAKQGGFPPRPRWQQAAKTVDDVPEAKGAFSWGDGAR